MKKRSKDSATAPLELPPDPHCKLCEGRGRVSETRLINGVNYPFNRRCSCIKRGQTQPLPLAPKTREIHDGKAAGNADHGD